MSWQTLGRISAAVALSCFLLWYWQLQCLALQVQDENLDSLVLSQLPTMKLMVNVSFETKPDGLGPAYYQSKMLLNHGLT